MVQELGPVSLMKNGISQFLGLSMHMQNLIYIKRLKCYGQFSLITDRHITSQTDHRQITQNLTQLNFSFLLVIHLRDKMNLRELSYLEQFKGYDQISLSDNGQTLH